MKKAETEDLMKISFSLWVFLSSQQNFCCDTDGGRSGVDKAGAAINMQTLQSALGINRSIYSGWINSDKSQ